MSRKGKLAVAAYSVSAVVVLGTCLLILFRSEDYARFLPAAVLLSGLLGVAVALYEDEEEAR